MDTFTTATTNSSKNSNISYIIPFNSKIDDIFSLRKVLNWLSIFKGIEVIIVEYSNTSTILDNISDPFIHMPIKSDKLTFSPSWAYNVGIRRCNSETVICGDSSTITNPKNIKESIKLINFGYQMVKPFNKKLDIKSNELDNFDVMDKNINSPLSSEFKELCDGITIYNKKSLMEIGGWEEKFKMEYFINFQSHKVNLLLKNKEIDGKGYSLNSMKPHNNEIIERDNKLNIKLKSFSGDDLVRYINKTYSSIGMINKYK